MDPASSDTNWSEILGYITGAGDRDVSPCQGDTRVDNQGLLEVYREGSWIPVNYQTYK